jgi:hypothetical protein
MQSGLTLFPSKVASTTSSEIQRYSTQLGAVDVTHRRRERGSRSFYQQPLTKTSEAHSLTDIPLTVSTT